MRYGALAFALLLVASVGCKGSSSGPGVAPQGAGSGRIPPQQSKTTTDSLNRTADGAGGGGDYAYDETGKRDPFRSFILEQVRDVADHVERGPLEAFDLTQLSLVAVVWGTDRARALVQDPSGRAYVVEEGARIGKNEGRVIKIDDNLVSVRETYVDYLGERTTKEIEMRIRQSQGG